MPTSALGVLLRVRGSSGVVILSWYVSPPPFSSPLLLDRGPGVSHGWLVNRGFSPLLVDCFRLACFSVVLLVCFQWRPPDSRRALYPPLSCSLLSCLLLLPMLRQSVVCFVACDCVLVLLVAGVAVCFAPVLWWVCEGGCLFFRSSAC